MRTIDFSQLFHPIGRMRLIKCGINKNAQDEYSISSNVLYDICSGKKAVLVLPFSGYGISVRYEYDSASNYLVSPAVANALHLSSQSQLIMWDINSYIDPGIRLNFDSYVLGNGSFGVRLIPHGEILFSSSHPENQEEISKLLQKVLN
jgi:hypothetical protein